MDFRHFDQHVHQQTKQPESSRSFVIYRDPVEETGQGTKGSCQSRDTKSTRRVAPRRSGTSGILVENKARTTGSRVTSVKTERPDIQDKENIDSRTGNLVASVKANTKSQRYGILTVKQLPETKGLPGKATNEKGVYSCNRAPLKSIPPVDQVFSVLKTPGAKITTSYKRKTSPCAVNEAKSIADKDFRGENREKKSAKFPLYTPSPLADITQAYVASYDSPLPLSVTYSPYGIENSPHVKELDPESKDLQKRFRTELAVLLEKSTLNQEGEGPLSNETIDDASDESGIPKINFSKLRIRTMKSKSNRNPHQDIAASRVRSRLVNPKAENAKNPI